MGKDWLRALRKDWYKREVAYASHLAYHGHLECCAGLAACLVSHNGDHEAGHCPS